MVCKVLKGCYQGRSAAVLHLHRTQIVEDTKIQARREEELPKFKLIMHNKRFQVS